MKKILLVEDDKSIREMLTDFLQFSDFHVSGCARGDQAIGQFKLLQPDLVILDLNLPGLNGIEVCRGIRALSDIPVVMLTARREERDQLEGLDVGADDYLIKPFSPKVLVAKVKKLFERIPPSRQTRRTFKNLELDMASQRVYQRSEPDSRVEIHLTPAEFNLLKVLTQHPGQAFSRDELIDMIYGDSIPPDIFDRTIDSHIKNLRKKLGKGDYIMTVRTIGYQAAE